MTRRHAQFALLGTLLLAAVLGCSVKTSAAPVAAGSDGPFAYRSAAFQSLVDDSYRESKGSGHGPAAFDVWLDTSYRDSGVHLVDGEDGPLETTLDRERTLLAGVKDPGARTKEELRFLDREFRVIKKILTHFTLDRGFEFRYAAQNGERQCLLQAVLIAAMAQRAGLHVGVAMVFRNPSGQESNVGHVVTVARLSNGNDILVDASDPVPFIRHQGLLLREGSTYRFVRPEYVKGGEQIAAYRWEDGGRRELPSSFQTLDFPYVRSQFYYYRGERTPGGLVLGPRTAKGLEESARLLGESVKLCPANPLSTYMLGRVRQEQGRSREAGALLLRAKELYVRYGWLPAGPRGAASR